MRKIYVFAGPDFFGYPVVEGLRRDMIFYINCGAYVSTFRNSVLLRGVRHCGPVLLQVCREISVAVLTTVVRPGFNALARLVFHKVLKFNKLAEDFIFRLQNISKSFATKVIGKGK